LPKTLFLDVLPVLDQSSNFATFIHFETHNRDSQSDSLLDRNLRSSKIFLLDQDFYLLQILSLHKPVEGITALIIAFSSSERASSFVASIQILTTARTGDFRNDVRDLL